MSECEPAVRAMSAVLTEHAFSVNARLVADAPLRFLLSTPGHGTSSGMWRFMILAAALSSCTQFPELDVSVPPSAEAARYPDLQPLDPLLAREGQLAQDNAQTEADLEARVAALQARAARLRRQVIDPATRARMRNGVTTG